MVANDVRIDEAHEWLNYITTERSHHYNFLICCSYWFIFRCPRRCANTSSMGQGPQQLIVLHSAFRQESHALPPRLLTFRQSSSITRYYRQRLQMVNSVPVLGTPGMPHLTLASIGSWIQIPCHDKVASHEGKVFLKFLESRVAKWLWEKSVYMPEKQSVDA